LPKYLYASAFLDRNCPIHSQFITQICSEAIPSAHCERIIDMNYKCTLVAMNVLDLDKWQPCPAF